MKHPRALTYNMLSKKYDEIGIVASELEKLWEQPKKLNDADSSDGMFLYGTDGFGMFLKVSIDRQLNRQAQASLLFILPDGTTYELPNAPDTIISDIDGRDTFNAAGIKFQMIDAMRKWRIIFNGLVKRVQNGEESEVHLRINVMWTNFSRPYEIKREFSRKMLAAAMTREKWTGQEQFLRVSQPEQDGVDQWGVMYGTYQEASQNQETKVYLRGIRQRRWGPNKVSTLQKKLDIIGTCEDGNYFYLKATNDSARLSHEVSGHLYHPSGFLYTISQCNLSMDKLGENGPVPRHFSLRFTANRHEYHAIINLMPSQFENFAGRPWHHQSTTYPCHLTLNSRQGRVLFISTETYNGHCPLDVQTSLPFLAQPSRSLTVEETEKLVVLFNEEACRYESLVGGKGASLALLSTNLKSMPIECNVPQGFCVTVHAWKKQIDGNKDVQLKLDELDQVGRGVLQGPLGEHCQEASDLLAAAPVDPFIQDSIRQALHELFGGEIETKRLAIRSSAIGEDGEDLSSAGQNATVLGCKGFDAIIKGLQKCWSSLLSYQSVEYRRQHGEPLIPGMGVVVQEMVASEVAGVLFTVNPNDGDPSKMILTANYGLGESVVSGDAEPDTFILKRTSAGHLSVLEETIGSKHLKIVLTEDGTSEEEINAEHSGSSCLSEEMAIQLGQLGIHLEKVFGGPRDIEFGIRNNFVYLLQARPITSLDSWSDDELRHEYDSAILMDGDHLTTANLGEVFPGAGSPLSVSVVVRAVDAMFHNTWRLRSEKFVDLHPWSNGRIINVQQNHALLDVISGMKRLNNQTTIDDNDRAVDMSMFGHLVTTEAMHTKGLQRFGTIGHGMKLKILKLIVIDLLTISRRVQRLATKYTNYSFPVDHYTDSKTLYHDICSHIPILNETATEHLWTSGYSSFTQTLAFIILLDGRKEWTTDLYTEMAQLLSSISDVESAEVPVELKKLAAAIINSSYGQDFVKQSTEDALKMLQNDQGQAGSLLRQFLVRHGHRSVMEFDLLTETWGINQSSLVEALQTMVANPTSVTISPKKVDDEAWIENVKKTKPNKYRALKFIVSCSRQAVVCRETTKSVIIRSIHYFRLAYRRLGQLMVSDGKIPDAGLVFFFTHSELEQVINSRGAPLITKAVRRRKLHPEMDAIVFPELSSGLPEAIETEDEPIDAGANGVHVAGTPVFKGMVRAKVRVALNLQEARLIQCGEILITRSTDIGWSPYFPLLSGVVTELGGLISHGAVVAREYGLPCIVGAQTATSVFRTGDTVVLDGSKGTITRVDVRETETVEQ